MTSEWFNRVKGSALGWTTTVEFTYDVACMAIARNIPGDFVECGIYAGAQAAFLARAIMDHGNGEGRRVHLFDSFMGISLPGPEDLELLHQGGGVSMCKIEDVKKNMADWGVLEELLVYHPGWFEQTIPACTDPAQIAVLRLDGDMYSSTKASLALYPRVSPGGYVIVDDYQLSGCRQAVNEFFDQGAPAPIYFRKPR